MKATGIVRRIDDLGRVVIPKEIRRTMHIREGDPLEIYTDEGGRVIFKKYSQMGELGDTAAGCAETLYRVSGLAAAVCDKEKVIAAAGLSKKELIGKKISVQMAELLEKRKSIPADTLAGLRMQGIKDCDRMIVALTPINSMGDILGGVMLLADTPGVGDRLTEKLCEAGAMFLGKQLED